MYIFTFSHLPKKNTLHVQMGTNTRMLTIETFFTFLIVKANKEKAK